MATPNRLEIKVGLLVLAGAVSILGMILAADQVRIERRYRVTAYLVDAGGLRLDSPVTLSGIAVGRVVAVEAVPPAQLGALPGRIRATCELPLSADLPADAEAKLSSSGLFGDAFLALSPAPAADGRVLPKDGTGVLVVGPGFLEKASAKAESLLAAADDLLAPEVRLDAKRLVRSAADLADHAARIAARLDAQGERMERILIGLETTSTQLSSLATDVNARTGPLLDRADRLLALAERDGGAILAHAASASARLDAAAAKADALLAAPEVAALLRDVAATMATARTLAEALQGGQGVLGQLLMNRDLAGDVHRIAVDAASVARTIADQPSRVVFDASEEETAAAKAARERELMRRAVREGFVLEPVAP